MAIIYPTLQDMYREPEPYRGQKERTGFLPGAQPVPPWIPDLVTSDDKWLENRPGIERVYFPSPEEENAADALQSYQRDTNAWGLFNKMTGLPALLIGLLDTPDLPIVASSASNYLDNWKLIFGGRSGELDAIHVRFSQWDDQTTQVAFQQTNSQQIRIYGARFVATYDAQGRLVLVTNSFYPTEPLPQFPELNIKKAQLKSLLAEVIPEYLGFSGLLDPNTTQWPLWESWLLPVPLSHGVSSIQEQLHYTLTFWSREVDGWHWKMPTAKALPNSAGSFIRPALRVPILDSYGDPWAAWLDAVDFTLLKLDYLVLHNKLNYELFPTTKAALDNLPELIELDLGNGGTALRTSPKVKMTGDRLFDPQDPTHPSNPPGGASDIRSLLGATVYHHTWTAQHDYAELLKSILLVEQVIPNPRFSNPLEQVVVNMSSISGDARFLPQSGEILFRTGVTTQPPVAEPAQDGEVITHEFTHALLHYLYPHLMEHTLVDEWEILARGLDEGLAFYLACLQESNAQWGDFAYQMWKPARDLDNVPVSFALSAFAGDPAGEFYGYAIWWARLLWSLHQKTSVAPNLERVLFKTLHALAGLVPTTDGTVNNELEDDLRTAFTLTAQILYLLSDPSTMQPDVKASFAQVQLIVA